MMPWQKIKYELPDFFLDIYNILDYEDDALLKLSDAILIHPFENSTLEGLDIFFKVPKALREIVRLLHV